MVYVLLSLQLIDTHEFGAARGQSYRVIKKMEVRVLKKIFSNARFSIRQFFYETLGDTKINK